MPTPLSLFARNASLVCFLLASMVEIPAPASAGELTKLKVVVSNTHGKRVERANVIVTFGNGRTVKSLGRKINTQWEMHATQEGVADIPEMPKGKITVRVTAPGYQTFGQVYEVNEDERIIEVTLNPPQGQYSSHEQ